MTLYKTDEASPETMKAVKAHRSTLMRQAKNTQQPFALEREVWIAPKSRVWKGSQVRQVANLFTPRCKFSFLFVMSESWDRYATQIKSGFINSHRERRIQICINLSENGILVSSPRFEWSKEYLRKKFSVFEVTLFKICHRHQCQSFMNCTEKGLKWRTASVISKELSVSLPSYLETNKIPQY
jgi:hypothetical protein